MDVEWVVEQLEVMRGHRQVFSPLSWHQSSGEVVHLVGGNGSGKTTALRAMAGLCPHRGLVCWRGGERLGCVGFVGHHPGLLAHATLSEQVALTLACWNRVMPHEAVDEALKGANLDRFKQRYPHQLSAGQQQRLALLLLDLAGPPVWLLDEPLHTLDPPSRQWLSARLDHHLAHQGLLILTTHVHWPWLAACKASGIAKEVYL